jgi:hypothetical protein
MFSFVSTSPNPGCRVRRHERPDESWVAALDGQPPRRLGLPRRQKAVDPGLEPVVVVHEQVEVFRVPVSKVNSPQRGTARQVEARLDAGRHAEDRVLERVQDVVEVGRVHG